MKCLNPKRLKLELFLSSKAQLEHHHCRSLQMIICIHLTIGNQTMSLWVEGRSPDRRLLEGLEGLDELD
jgi:hypothetical protein